MNKLYELKNKYINNDKIFIFFDNNNRIIYSIFL